MFNSEKSNTVTLSARASFIVGLVGGVLVLCTLGFFILLSIVLSHGAQAEPTAADNPSAAAAPAPQPAAPPEDQVGDLAPVSDSDWTWGDADAAVTLVVYSDFECPYCGSFHDTLHEVMDEYAEDEVQIVFRNFPLSFHPNAAPAAMAAGCAAAQGEFWAFADGLYGNQGSLGDALYESLAKELKLNLSKFNDCLENQDYAAKVSADRAGGAAAGISGTPGTIVVAQDGSMEMIPGALPFASVKAMIDAAF